MARPSPKQLDLFIARIGDVPFRDDRDAMSLPMVSLSRHKRTKPIEYTMPNGAGSVKVTAPTETGIATIYDYDIILWLISQLNEQLTLTGRISGQVRFTPYTLLTAIGWGVSGRSYKRLEDAIDRLAATTIFTTIRQSVQLEGKTVRARNRFHWLENAQTIEEDATGKPIAMLVELPQWLVRGVQAHQILAIPPAYFDITSGLARWLYRLVRRHAGNQPQGWTVLFRTLHEKSGTTQSYKEFSRDLRELVVAEAGQLLEYEIILVGAADGERRLQAVKTKDRETSKRRVTG
jgi:plasmid replication initiation protein